MQQQLHTVMDLKPTAGRGEEAKASWPQQGTASCRRACLEMLPVGGRSEGTRQCRRATPCIRSRTWSVCRMHHYMLVLLLIAACLSATNGQAATTNSSCASTMTSGILQKLIIRSEQLCANQGQLLKSQGRGGRQCGEVAKRKCCRASDCAQGFRCECAADCGVRTCHLEPMQSQRLNCRRLRPPVHGSLAFVPGRSGAVQARCDSGYLLSGASSLMCNAATHTWSDDVPSCHRKCHLPILPENSHFKPGIALRSVYVRGQTLKIICNAGYRMAIRNSKKLRTSRRIKCQKNGNWRHHRKLFCTPRVVTSPPPSCCTFPALPAHATLHGGSKFCIGDVIQFSCQSCHRPVGNSHLACLNPANATRPEFRCEAITCPAPNLPRGFAVFSETASAYHCGAQLRVGCEGDQGSLDAAHVNQHITCNDNGTWSDLGALRPYMCESVAGPSNFRVTGRTESTVSLAWLPPAEHAHEVSWYEVRSQQTQSDDVVLQYARNFSASAPVAFTVSGLDSYTGYQFHVRAVYASTWYSQATQIVSAITEPEELEPPTDFTIRPHNNGATLITSLPILVSWREPLSELNITGYTVYYSTTSRVGQGYSRSNNRTTTETTMILNDLQPYVSYVFTIVSMTATGRSLPLRKSFKPRSATLRPRAPPTPQITRNGDQLEITVYPSADVHPFVLRYLVRAYCDERESVNSLEENDTPGRLQCAGQLKRVQLSKFYASEFNMGPGSRRVVRVNLSGNPNLSPGQRYRVQVSARSQAGTTTSCLVPAYFTV